MEYIYKQYEVETQKKLNEKKIVTISDLHLNENITKYELDDLIIKITGRYIVSNIVQILSYTTNENYIYANISKINGRFLCDSRVFVAPISVLKEYFLPNKEMINDSLGCYFEHILYYSISLWQNNGGKVKEFRCPINFIGVTGSTGKMLSKHPQSCFKALVRFYLHKLGIFRDRKK